MTDVVLTRVHGSVAEWSKALDLGSSLSGGVGSNPTAAKSHLFFFSFLLFAQNVLQEHDITCVLYVSQDPVELSVFGYVTQDHTTAKHICHVFRCFDSVSQCRK